MPKLVERRLTFEDSEESHQVLKPSSVVGAVNRISRASWRAIKRKRVIGVDGGVGEPCNPSICSPLTDRKLLSERTFGSSFARAMDHQDRYHCGGNSLLEALPFDLLVHIVCFLHHEELKPVFHVCQRLRTAVLIARGMHFDFTTPNRKLQGKCRVSPSFVELWPFSCNSKIQDLIQPVTPKAQRCFPKTGQICISTPATLLHDAKTPTLKLLPCRTSGCRRALYSQEASCQAVTQN